MLWLIRLKDKNYQMRSVRYYTFTVYKRDVTASAVTFHPVNENSGCARDSHSFLHHPTSPSITPIIPLSAHNLCIEYVFPTQDTDYALVTSARLLASIGRDDHLFFGGRHACFVP
ncbi:hypothetical protein EVAR_26979_1 [Eumeta japonica]|uniref:Uncharacterized protein n=1 Tax=Eumeta variegata TaxID=151549 RepID=A0A4C1VKR3_EUMVA|nr:hypothetical protein EVAR_26979_1 [Eumeta japonica]